MRIVLVNKDFMVHTPELGEETRIGHCAPIKVICTFGIVIGITKDVEGFEKMTHSKKLIAWM